MIWNMLGFFYLFFLNVNVNDDIVSKNIINNNIINNNKYERNDSILYKFQGIDGRNYIKEEVSENKILENYLKQELLINLESNDFHIYNKIDMMNKMPIIMDNIQVNELKPFQMNQGGLMNDWNFEEF